MLLRLRIATEIKSNLFMTETQLKKFLNTHIYKELTVVAFSDNIPLLQMYSKADFERILFRTRRMGLGVVSFHYRAGQCNSIHLIPGNSVKPARSVHWAKRCFERVKGQSPDACYGLEFFIPDWCSMVDFSLN